MLVGEAPGADEDVEGSPFIGKAGRLLDHIIAVLGLERENFYITNTVKCRPPDNKLPSKKDEREEIVEACLPYLKAEFQRLKPKVVVALGVTALQALTESKQSTMKNQGMMVEDPVLPVPTVAAFHPSYILHHPSDERVLAAAIAKACTLANVVMSVRTQTRPFAYDKY